MTSITAPTGFQTPASMTMASLICTHNDIYYFLSVILSIVTWILAVAIFKHTKYISPFSEPKLFWWEDKTEAAEIFDSCTALEILWTIIPTLILLFIGYPNISLLYALDQIPQTWFNIKITGHQWYWTYEYAFLNSRDQSSTRLSYDSTLVSDFDLLKILKEDSKRNLPDWFEEEYYNEPELDSKYVTVDNPLIIPAHVDIQAIVTSADVLHSWAVPALGVKVDACPGRLNRITFRADIDSRIYQIAFKSRILRYLGTMPSPYFVGYIGQCSELCGVGHGFMPIVVHAVHPEDLLPFFAYIFNTTPVSVDQLTTYKLYAGSKKFHEASLNFPELFYLGYKFINNQNFNKYWPTVDLGSINFARLYSSSEVFDNVDLKTGVFNRLFWISKYWEDMLTFIADRKIFPAYLYEGGEELNLSNYYKGFNIDLWTTKLYADTVYNRLDDIDDSVHYKVLDLYTRYVSGDYDSTFASDSNHGFSKALIILTSEIQKAGSLTVEVQLKDHFAFKHLIRLIMRNTPLPIPKEIGPNADKADVLESFVQVYKRVCINGEDPDLHIRFFLFKHRFLSHLPKFCAFEIVCNILTKIYVSELTSDWFKANGGLKDEESLQKFIDFINDKKTIKKVNDFKVACSMSKGLKFLLLNKPLDKK